MQRPPIAIIDANTLSVLGLKQILQQVIPIMEVHAFGSFEELEANCPDGFFHYFVAQDILLQHRQFFLDRQMKTIVLTPGSAPSARPSGFHCLCVHVPEEKLVRELLVLEQHAHAHGRNLPPMPRILSDRILSDREIEVLALIVEGHINKEVAALLNISLTTVVTHRKNIMEKLGMKSVSALTIYAVTHGYVDINKI